jgi:hypothetical protein
VFESIGSPRELITYQLGAALTMERRCSTCWASSRHPLSARAQGAAPAPRAGNGAADQEPGAAFQTLGAKVDDKSCPAIEGIEEGQALIKKAEDGLVDAVILSGATDTEHHEISVYEGLITKAEAMGDQDVVTLLQENLEQEQHTLEEVKRASRQLAQELARQTV